MATFNGEQFLPQQLESIARQTVAPAELVVNDDGSRDRTVEIVEDFAKRSPFPVRLRQNPKNVGFGDNFLLAASRCSSEWIAFCDQDDVWHCEKVARTLDAIRRVPDAGLIVHDITSCDSKLRPTAFHASGIYLSRSLAPREGDCRTYPGCSMVANRRLIEVCDWRQRPSLDGGVTRLPHDAWIALVAYATERRYFTRHSLILYRRHETTLTGYNGPGLLRRAANLKDISPGFFTSASAYFDVMARWFGNAALAVALPEGEEFDKAARSLAKMSRIYADRADLYRTRGRVKKLRRYLRLNMVEGYRSSLGLRDHVKDLLRTLSSG